MTYAIFPCPRCQERHIVVCPVRILTRRGPALRFMAACPKCGLLGPSSPSFRKAVLIWNVNRRKYRQGNHEEAAAPSC